MRKYDFRNFVPGVTFLTNKMKTNPFSLALSKSSSIYDTRNQLFEKKSKSHNPNMHVYDLTIHYNFDCSHCSYFFPQLASLH